MAEYPGATVESDPIAEADLATHEAATTGVHGTGVNITADNIASYAAGAADASTTVKGVSKLSVAPASPTAPIAVGDNDPRNSYTRTPTDATVTDAKIATTLSPSKITGTAVVTADSRLSDARTPTTHATSHGSGGSDAVTLAESQVTGLVADLAAKVPKSLVDAKGDLLVGTADDVVARLGVGTNGQILTADSGASKGVAWADPVAPATEDRFTATGGQTAFTLTAAPTGIVMAFRNGLLLAAADFSVAGSTLTLTSGATGGDVITAVYGVAIGGGTALNNSTRVYNSDGAQALASGVETAIAFDQEVYDHGGLHNPGVNPERLTSQTDGTYSAFGTLRLPSGSGSRYIYLQKNGTETLAMLRLPAAATSIDLSVSCQAELAAGDYITLIGFQDSGSSYSLSVASHFHCSAGMALIAETP